MQRGSDTFCEGNEEHGVSQVIHLEEGDVEGEDAVAFFSSLGASDPKSVKIASA